MNSAARRRLVVALAACMITGCLEDSRAPAAQRPAPTTVPIPTITHDALYVVNGGDNTLSVIDTETNAVVGTIGLQNVEFPHHVYLSADRSKLVLAVPGMEMGGGHRAHGAAVGTEGAVLLLDALTGATVAARRTPAMNHNALYTPTGDAIWTAQMGTPGKVLILDPASLASRGTITVGVLPSEITFSNDGRRAFVANTGSGDVSVIDVGTKTVTDTISVGASPVGAWQGPNGIAYVDNEQDGTLTAIDTQTLSIVLTYRLGFTPAIVAYGPDDNIWVADPYNEKLVLLKARADEKVGTIDVGAGAHGITFNGDGRTAYVSNEAGGTISVIDVATRRETQSIKVGSLPNGMVWRAK